MAVCHSVIIREENNTINYNASSTDELALVNMAKYSGYEFLGLN